MNAVLVLRRRAFTLVELLVVIAILGILMAVLLPAVQRAREAANRSVCTGHLKQIGIALLNYHDAHRSFPPGYLSGVDSAGDDLGPGWGWAAMLLPHIEQRPLFDRIQFDQPIEASSQMAVRTSSIPAYLCPSDRAVPVWAAVTRDAAGNPVAAICDVASANYVGVFGVTEPGVDGEGVFFRNSAIALGDVTDGASVTLLVGERAHRWSDSTWVGAVTKAELFPPPDSPAVPFIENASGMVLGHSFEGPPNATGLECNDFSSEHADGANLVFCDGHVQFISSSMDKKLFRALSTRAGHESTGDF
jgi:prepilin-type N-terminal cleavage/methylation domain-containing protein/prepilin-type processing-associated H-X9-DG protein